MFNQLIAALSAAVIAPAEVQPTQPTAKPPTTVSPVKVQGRQQDDTRPKLKHIMREVSATQITVTKRPTVTKLDQQPTLIDNNLQQLFSR